MTPATVRPEKDGKGYEELSQATAAIMVVRGPGWRKCPVLSGR